MTKLERLKAFDGHYKHYTYELGDGLILQATRPEIMANHELKHTIIKELIESRFGPLSGMRILDIGTASGYHALRLAADGAIVTAFDPDSDLIAQGQLALDYAPAFRGVNCRFQTGDIVTYDEVDGAFDVVLCAGVLYHIRNVIDALINIHRLCTRGAVIESCVLGEAGLVQTLADPAYRFCFDGELAFVPTAELIEDLCNRVGFQTESWRASDISPEPGLARLSEVDREIWQTRWFYRATR